MSSCLVRDWVPRSELVAAGLIERVRVVRGDVRDQETLERALGEYEIATVFHLAAQTTVGVANRNPVSTLDTNIRGTWTLLEACRRSPTVQQIVIASSDKAYGDQDVLPYTEETPVSGRHPYDVSKSCADLLAQMYAKSYRPAGVRHPLRQLLRRRRSELESHRPRNDSFRAARRAAGDSVGRPASPATTSTSRMALAPTCCWPSNWPRRRRSRGEVFNFSYEQPMTVLELVARILDVMGSTLEPDVRNEASNEIRDQYLDATKARTDAGLVAGVHVRDRPARDR